MADSSQWKVPLEADEDVWKPRQDAHADQTARNVDEIAELYTLVGGSPSGNPNSLDTMRAAVTAGSGSAYTLTFTPAFTSLVEGIMLKVRWHATSGASPTLNLNGLGAVALVKPDGTAIGANDLMQNGSGLVVYNANLTKWMVVSGIPVTIPASNGEFRSEQKFTTSGTWTKPAGLVRIRVTVVGGGGGGAGGDVGSARDGGSGGGAGASIKIIEAASLGATETVTVGPGGAAQASATHGNSGATSSFGAHCSATGGGGGRYSGSNDYRGGSGGLGSGGDQNMKGQGAGIVNGGAPGGASIMGGGGRRAYSFGGINMAAETGGTYGGGGGGGIQVAGYTTGAAGGDGIVIVEEFF